MYGSPVSACVSNSITTSSSLSASAVRCSASTVGKYCLASVHVSLSGRNSVCNNSWTISRSSASTGTAVDMRTTVMRLSPHESPLATQSSSGSSSDTRISQSRRRSLPCQMAISHSRRSRRSSSINIPPRPSPGGPSRATAAAAGSTPRPRPECRKRSRCCHSPRPSRWG